MTGPSAATLGQAGTYTATVLPVGTSGVPTGTIQFVDAPVGFAPAVLGSATLTGGTASLSISPLQANGAHASLSTSALTPGSHSITAVYSGDANYATSTSAILSQVAKGTTTISVASPGNSIYGQAVTFTASISPSAATGTVQFLDGATVLGTATISGGTAALAVSSLTVGAHSITGVYSGDASYTGSTSSAWTQNVGKAGSPNPSLAGQTITLSAAVTPGASGTVQFLDGSTVIGTAALTGGAASMTTAALAAGFHTLTAAYSGDANFNGSSSAAVVETVKSSTVTSVTSKKASVVYGQTVQFTASVSPSAASGSVQFNDGGSPLGAATLSGGSAVLTISTLAVGAHSITAVYSGDAIYNPSTSVAWIQTVTAPPAPTLAANPSPDQANLGESVTVTLVGANFFPGATALNWTSGSGVTVSNINVISSTSLTATFTVAANATVGRQLLTVTTPGGTSASHPFQVYGVPTISSISPTRGTHGTAVTVKLRGTSFSSDSVVRLSGTGIVTSNQSITNDGTVLNITLTIAGNAPLGPQSVTVTNSAGASNPIAFTVQ